MISRRESSKCIRGARWQVIEKQRKGDAACREAAGEATISRRQ
jgi:hypothetical protein